MGGGGASEGLQKRGGWKSSSHAKGGHNKFWGSFYLVAWSFSHFKGGGGAKIFHSLKGGGMKSFTLSWGGAQKVLPCLEGGGAQKVSDQRLSHFVAPLPVISDRSLRDVIYPSICLNTEVIVISLLHQISCLLLQFHVFARRLGPAFPGSLKL